MGAASLLGPGPRRRDPRRRRALQRRERRRAPARGRRGHRRMKLESLDFIYMPSEDPAAEIEQYVGVLGAEVAFAIEAFGTRVAMLRLGPPGSPALLLAGHMHSERPVLLYRVESLERAVEEVEAAGGTVGPGFGFPHGDAHEIELPGGNRIAVYELTRPERAKSIEGRRDF